MVVDSILISLVVDSLDSQHLHRRIDLFIRQLSLTPIWPSLSHYFAPSLTLSAHMHFHNEHVKCMFQGDASWYRDTYYLVASLIPRIWFTYTSRVTLYDGSEVSFYRNEFQLFLRAYTLQRCFETEFIDVRMCVSLVNSHVRATNDTACGCLATSNTETRPGLVTTSFQHGHKVCICLAASADRSTTHTTHTDICARLQ